MLLTAWLVALLSSIWGGSAVAMGIGRREELREEVRGLFRHGYDGYMKYAFPADELKSLSCAPLYRSSNPADHGINDIHANVSLTLLDTLSSLPLIHPEAFPQALKDVTTRVSFDQDVKIQVFELTIRALGALLSTYQYLDGLPTGVEAQSAVLYGPFENGAGVSISAKSALGRRKLDVDLKTYQPKILELARDLGERLLPAFNTVTGIPYARVNLRYGLESGESVETCTAGAGSLILEFTVLSRLTGDDRFESLATNAYMALWNRRSPHNLLGNTIGATHGHWLSPGMSGTGAGIDSFFEYGMKAAIMMGDDTFLDIFHDSYAAIQNHVRTPDGFLYRPVQLRLLHPAAQSTIDSLGAFFPGLQVLAGDLESAIKGHLVYWNLWRRYSGIPESFLWADRRTEWAGYPGRPEFIESTYYLYQATKDPFYLRVGERVLEDLTTRMKTKCGFATLKNVETDEREDRMESFMLSETLKYLYLLFDPSPPPPLSNKVFSTEGHPLYLLSHLLKPPSGIRRAINKGEDLYCPVYNPPTLNGLVVGIEKRRDYEYARSLIFGPGVDGRVEERGQVGWWEGGWCEIPKAPKYAFDVLLAPPEQHNGREPVAEDLSPSSEKVHRDEMSGDWIIADVDGLKLGVRWRFDGRGYDVSSIGPHRVRPGQQVLITDRKMDGYLPVPTTKGFAEVMLRFSYLDRDAGISVPTTEQSKSVFLHAVGATATFGRAFAPPPPRSHHQRSHRSSARHTTKQTHSEAKAKAQAQAPFSGTTWTPPTSFTLGGGAVRLLRPNRNPTGCVPISSGSFAAHDSAPFVLLLDRGNCTFLEKLVHAVDAGAEGVLISPLLPSSFSTHQEQDLSHHDTGSDRTHGGEGEPDGYEDEGGLIRPSADGESKETLHHVKDSGLIYLDRAVGEMLRTVFRDIVDAGGDETARDGPGRGGDTGIRREVFVEVVPIEHEHEQQREETQEWDDTDGQEPGSDHNRGSEGDDEGEHQVGDGEEQSAGKRRQRQERKRKQKYGKEQYWQEDNEPRGAGAGRLPGLNQGREGREGRVMVADHVVWNLRVVEVPLL